MSISDSEFEQEIRSTLESGVTNLDAETRSRLAAMRNRALEHKPLWSRWLTIEHWIPLTAFATIAVLAVSLVFFQPHQGSPEQIALQDSDIALEVLFSTDDHDDVGDPDFYVWLDMAMAEDEEPKNAG